MGLESVLLNVGLIVGIDAAGVAGAGVSVDGVDLVDGFLQVVDLVNGQDDAELFAGQGILKTGAGLFHHDELGVIGDLDA